MDAAAQLSRAVEIYAVVHFVIVGLSHLFSPKAWVRLFVLMREQGEPGAMAHGFLSLFFGSMIVAFHNDWSGGAVALTLVGWLYLAKAASCIVTPAVQLRSLARVSVERAHELRGAGVFYLLLAGWVGARLAGLAP